MTQGKGALPMRYRRSDTGDPEIDKKLIAEDYDMLFPRLQAADTEPGFHGSAGQAGPD